MKIMMMERYCYRKKVEIEESDDMLTLYKKTFSLIPDLTIDALNRVYENNFHLKPNDKHSGSYHHFLHLRR